MDERKRNSLSHRISSSLFAPGPAPGAGLNPYDRFGQFVEAYDTLLDREGEDRININAMEVPDVCSNFFVFVSYQLVFPLSVQY